MYQINVTKNVIQRNNNHQFTVTTDNISVTNHAIPALLMTVYVPNCFIIVCGCVLCVSTILVESTCSPQCRLCCSEHQQGLPESASSERPRPLCHPTDKTKTPCHRCSVWPPFHHQAVGDNTPPTRRGRRFRRITPAGWTKPTITAASINE